MSIWSFHVTAMFLLLSTAAASAQDVFESYASYYSSLPHLIFQATDKQAFKTEWIFGKGLTHVWRGNISGKERSVELTGRRLIVDGWSLAVTKAVRFPGENAPEIVEMGEDATLYLNQSYGCIEGVSSSARGSATRHVQVYFVVRPFSRKPGIYQLSSLFASCAGVRLDNYGQLHFDRVTYRYAPGQDDAVGVIFHDFSIGHKTFIDNHQQVSATFSDPENVYRFTIDRLDSETTGFARAKGQGD